MIYNIMSITTFGIFMVQDFKYSSDCKKVSVKAIVCTMYSYNGSLS